MNATTTEPAAEDELTSKRGGHMARGIVSFAAVPVFLGSLYFAARGGIEIADRQVPPASVRQPGEIEVGGIWRPNGGGGKLFVADAVQALREHEFQQSLPEPTPVPGVRQIDLGDKGWEIQVMPGGDRRFLPAKVVGGALDGEEFWLMVKELQGLALPAEG
jgi:hypothetical protein